MLKMKNYNYDCAKFYTLNELVDFRNGKGHEKNIVQDGEYIVVNSKFISTDGEVKKFSDSQICPVYKNDILMVMSDLPNGRALAKCFLVEEDNKYTLNQRIGAFKVKREDIINTRYLFYCLNRNFQLLKFDNGVDQTNLRKDDILKIRIAVPPLEVQCEIVHILDDFTLLSAELKARKKQYEYYRDNLLTFPKETKRIRFGDIACIQRGASPRPISQFITSDENAVNWIKIGDVEQGAKYITHCKEKITVEGAKKSRYVKKGDFVLSNSMSFGRPYILAVDGCIHDGWLSISEFEQYFMSDFLYHLLNSSDIQNEFKKRASFGGAVQNLNADIVRSIELPIPSIEKQKEIVNILDRFDKLCNDISNGLPAEIEKRQKQYEYYRDKLLSFKEVEEDV